MIEHVTSNFHCSHDVWIGLSGGRESWQWADGGGVDWESWSSGEPDSKQQCQSIYDTSNCEFVIFQRYITCRTYDTNLRCSLLFYNSPYLVKCGMWQNVHRTGLACGGLWFMVHVVVLRLQGSVWERQDFCHRSIKFTSVVKSAYLNSIDKLIV